MLNICCIFIPNPVGRAGSPRRALISVDFPHEVLPKKTTFRPCRLSASLTKDDNRIIVNGAFNHVIVFPHLLALTANWVEREINEKNAIVFAAFCAGLVFMLVQYGRGLPQNIITPCYQFPCLWAETTSFRHFHRYFFLFFGYGTLTSPPTHVRYRVNINI